MEYVSEVYKNKHTNTFNLVTSKAKNTYKTHRFKTKKGASAVREAIINNNNN